MTFRLAAFDFDGTLADSFEFFVASHNTLARRHRFAELDLSRLDEFRGMQIRELMRRHGVPMWKLPIIARDFLELMARDVERIRPFEGITATLHALADQGVTLALVTSNSLDNVNRVLGEDLMRRFRFLECGSSLFGKQRRLARLVRAARVDPASSIYVGDQRVDAEAARAAGIAFGAVHWGYATVESLEGYSPALSFRAVPDLHRIAQVPLNAA